MMRRDRDRAAPGSIPGRGVMYFGTFRKTVDCNPLEAEEGDVVFAYEADDGTKVEVLLLYDHGGYDTDTWGGNPIRHMEYGVGVTGKDIDHDTLEELMGDDAQTYGTKGSARADAKDLVERLLEMGHGRH